METSLSVADMMMISLGLKAALGGKNYEGNDSYCYYCLEFIEDCDCSNPDSPRDS